MSRVAWLLAVFLLALPGAGRGQTVPPASRTFNSPPDRVWFAVQVALTGNGWKIEETDPAAGRMVTDLRAVEFKDYAGLYAAGTRHRLRLTVQAAPPTGTMVVVERELFREERLFWTSQRKPLESSDRAVENAFLDAIQAALPASDSAPPAAEVRTPPPVERPPRSAAAAAPAPGGTYRVTYRVRGTVGRVALIYRNREGGTEQSTVGLPWQVSFDARRGNTFLYISAQNQEAAGSVTCEILLGDETRSTSTVTGPYVVAECANAAERP
jgi:hypothetical protein